MKKYSFKILLGALVTLFTFTSCLNELDQVPQDKDIVLADELFNDPANYKLTLAKLYAGLAVSGQEGPAGNSDISGIDEGFGQYLRGYWMIQELTTDEAVTGWGDAGIRDYHNQNWTSSNQFIIAIYNRIMYQITSTNAFLRETTDAKLSGRGVTGSLLAEIEMYKKEARFLRALSYYHAIDIFGTFPFVTEADPVGFFYPPQATRAELFAFVESELLAIEDGLAPPKSNEYARADQAAAWTLLAKLYLNAEVYISTAKYVECITYSNKVINSGYTLNSSYPNLFLADNDTANGVIFPIAFDGLRTQTYGGTPYIIHAAVGGKMKPADFGINGGWGGNRTTSALVDKFDLEINPAAANSSLGAASTWGIVGALTGWGGSPDLKMYETGVPNVFAGFYTVPAGELKFRQNSSWDNNYGGADGILVAGGPNFNLEPGTYKFTMNLANNTYAIQKDPRGMFFTEGQTLEIEAIGSFGDGYAISKFKNVTKNGAPGSDTSGNFTDTDFPLFRLADVYLMYAEATLRGGGGNLSTALGYVNDLRKRAYGAGGVQAIDLDFILDERARELYWEGHRRTDLVRYGRLTDGNYVWPWKGGAKDGISTSPHFNILPIPATDLNANPNLKQNPGY
jgi:hypothetical protein